jgi:hypothetical protein
MNKKIISLALATTLLPLNTFAQSKDTKAPIKTLDVSTANNTTDIKYALKNDKTEPTKKSDSNSGGFQVGVGLGVLGGANAQIGYRIPTSNDNFWKNRFGFRLDYNSWKPLESYIEDYLEDEPIKVDDNILDAKITGEQIGALIDFYPFGNTWALGNFRISAGYYDGDFSIAGSLDKTAGGRFAMESATTGQKLYYEVDANANLKAALDYEVKGPYAGLGFDVGLFWGLKMYFDAGVVFTDRPTITTDISGTGTLAIYNDDTYTNPTIVDIDTSNEKIQQLLNDTKVEYEEELEDITKEYFPMIKLGFLFRF